MENNLKDQHYKNMGIMLQMDILTFEAESVAYTVCQYLGLDTRDYSFGYITGWSSGREQKELRASLECIRNTAAELIDGVESRCLDRPPPEPVPQSQKRRTKGRKKRARTSKVPSI